MLTFQRYASLVSLSFHFFFSFSFLCSHNNLQERILHTPYGDFSIGEQVLIELLDCPSMQRLQKIHQYGISFYTKTPYEYNRYDHSVGVLALLHYYKCPIAEQIAGLLHDISHTVFSHVGDFLFKHQNHESSYQDDIHEWFLKQTEIPAILKKYGIKVEDISPKKGTFKALEQDLPDVCADRLEYVLHGALLEHRITKEAIQEILKDLSFEHERWFFRNASAAKQYALLSLYLTEHIFGTAWNAVTYEWMGETLRYALSIGLITKDDIHFSTDDKIMNVLKQASDPTIKTLLHKIFFHQECFSLGTADSYDYYAKPKFRGVNPWVKTSKGFQQLTQLESSFKHEFERVQSLMAQGWYIQFTNKST
jgi:uncharacterized protein